jgi:DNA-binding MarR family transcriptional regulator
VDRDGALELLDSCLWRIRRAQSSRRAIRTQSERSGVALSPLAVSILSELRRHGPGRVQSVADRVNSELTRVSREIRSLESSGDVVVQADAEDGRARVVDLTEIGQQRWKAYQGASREMLDELLTYWDDDDLSTFAVLFDRFLVGPLPDGPHE